MNKSLMPAALRIELKIVGPLGIFDLFGFVWLCLGLFGFVLGLFFWVGKASFFL